MKATYFLSCLIAVIASGFTIQAQNQQVVVIDDFEKANLRSLTGASWHTSSDSVNGGSSRIKADYIKDKGQHSQVMKFSYSLQKGNWKWQPYVTLNYDLTFEQFPDAMIQGIAYEYKGARHTFIYKTISVLDFAFFQKEVPESEEWKTVFIPFAEISQPAWGTKVRFDPADVQSLTWQMWGNNNDTGKVYLDNVRIIAKPDNKSQASGKSDSILYHYKPGIYISKIFNPSHDTLFKGVLDYQSKSLQYIESMKGMDLCRKKADSLLSIINSSSFSQGDQVLFRELIHLTLNNTLGDVYSKVNKTRRGLIKKFNKCIPLSLIYNMDKEFRKQTAMLEYVNSWSAKIWRFSSGNINDYMSAPLSALKEEVAIYGFRKNEVIADIGAGSGYFEQVVSKYCDSLTVYVNEIDSVMVNGLEVKLKLLELRDNKNIHFVTVLGNERSTHLPEAMFDKIIVKNAFHHFYYPKETLQDFKILMKKGASLFIVDIMVDEIEREPECKIHQTREVLMKHLTDNGFVLVNETKLSYNDFKCFEFKLSELAK